MASDSGPGSRMIKVQAVGRPFQLGMLYDCRSDVLIPGITLWDRDIIEKDMTMKKTNSTKLEIKTSDSLSDKADVLDIDANLKMSFMSGLISVEGSAKYLDDKVSSNNQERVTLSYHCLTKFESLNMGTLATEKIQHTKVFDDEMATHVVTGIQSGANVLFIFDKQHEDSESKKTVKGNVKVLVKSIPSFKIEGDASVDLVDADKSLRNSLNCTFHGDVRPKTNPTTFEEAIKVYKELNDLVGEDGQPLTVWLYPLVKLDDKAAKLAREISVSVTQRVEDILEGFQNIFRKCYDLETNKFCSELSSFRNQVEDFKKLVKDHKLVFQKKILLILPKIRGGDEAAESALADAILKLSQSPFCADSLNNWIEEREKQLKVITHMSKFIEGVKCISSNDLEAELMDPEDEHTLCFMLEIPATDEQLVAMQNVAMQEYSGEKSSVVLNTERKKETKEEEIHQNRHTIESARRFRDFYMANKTKEMEKGKGTQTKEMEKGKGTKTAFFLSEVSSTSNKVRGSNYHFALGEVVTKAFLPPSRPKNLEISKISEDSVSLKWDKSERGTEDIEEYEIEYQTVVEGDFSNDNNIISRRTGNSSTEYVLSSLSSSTKYLFKCRAVVPTGVSAYCDASDPVVTLTESKKLQKMLQNVQNESSTSTKKIEMTEDALKELKKMLKTGEIYAKNVVKDVVLYSQISCTTMHIRLNEFSTTSPSESSTLLDFDLLENLISGCFINYTHKGHNLGELKINFSPEYPKRVDIMIMLCSGSNGSARFRGAGFNDEVYHQGKPMEFVACNYYYSDEEEGGKSNSQLHPVEEGGAAPVTEGVVFGHSTQQFGFMIFTRTRANNPFDGSPVIGHLTATALRELQAARDNKTITEVVFSQCGLLIDATVIA